MTVRFEPGALRTSRPLMQTHHGRDDSARGQVVVACVVTSLDDETLESWCQQNLAPYKVPQEFRKLAELPKRPSGKVDRKALEER